MTQVQKKASVYLDRLGQSFNTLNLVWEQTDLIDGSENYPFPQSFDEFALGFLFAVDHYIESHNCPQPKKVKEKEYSISPLSYKRNFIYALYRCLIRIQNICEDKRVLEELNRYNSEEHIIPASNFQEFLEKMKLWFESQFVLYGNPQLEKYYRDRF